MKNFRAIRVTLLLLLSLVLLAVPVTNAQDDANNQVQSQEQSQVVENNDQSQDTSIKVVAIENKIKNTQDINDAMPNQADFIFSYIPNQIYKVYTQEQRITDIQLQPGENIIFIGAGDTARWEVEQDVSGSGDQMQNHVFIKPLRADISTNIVISTDKHIYHLEVFATNFYTPIINWRYPADEKKALLQKQQQVEKEEAEVTGTFEVSSMNFNYKIDGKNYRWKPTMVFDDGTHTYIQMPETMKSDEAPALFIKVGGTLQLVNYRVKNGYYIVDRLFNIAELRCGKQTINIKRTGAQLNSDEPDEHPNH